MSKIQIQGGRIIDPAHQIDQIGAVYIVDNKIAAINDCPDGFIADLTLDATGQIVCPGFIDLSTRLREPGHSRKATFKSETHAALSAGITTMCLQPDTQPVIDSPAVVEFIKDHAKKSGYKQIYPIAALTQQLEGKELSSMLTLKQAGCVAVSNALKPVSNLLILRRAMEYAASNDLQLMFRPHEFSLSNLGCAHEGALATRYGLPAIPEAAETIALAQCLELAELTGCRVHFNQLSGRRSAIKIQQAKKYGIQVTADVAVHQLHLTEDDIEPFNSSYHVIPPFRTLEDQQALREALANGVIDAICSDHQPHDIDAKLGAFPETEPGIASLETLLPLTLQLINDGILSMSQGLAALTHKAAKIIRLDRGTLGVGCIADICIFDPQQNWQVNPQNWQSQGQNTPFWGQNLTGKVTYTLQSGKLVYKSS